MNKYIYIYFPKIFSFRKFRINYIVPNIKCIYNSTELSGHVNKYSRSTMDFLDYVYNVTFKLNQY